MEENVTNEEETATPSPKETDETETTDNVLPEDKEEITPEEFDGEKKEVEDLEPATEPPKKKPRLS